jgi:molybdate transport system ATP-binding protein
MPMVYVSHSISEVIAIASSALILEQGEVTAFDQPRRLLSRATSELEDEVSGGLDNLLEGQVIEAHTDGSPGAVQVGDVKLSAPTGRREFGERVVLALGARDIIIATTPPQGISARNILPGNVVSITGDDISKLVTADCGAEFMVEVTASAVSELKLATGSEIYLVIKSSSIAVMDAFKG